MDNIFMLFLIQQWHSKDIRKNVVSHTKQLHYTQHIKFQVKFCANILCNFCYNCLHDILYLFDTALLSNYSTEVHLSETYV